MLDKYLRAGTRAVLLLLVWDYEDNRVGVAAPDADKPVRLPRETDTLPPQLAARMLREA